MLPYLYNRPRLLETRYGIPIYGDSLKIGDSKVLVDSDSDTTMK